MTQHHYLFVSPSGDDRWSGTLAAPRAAADDGPFATLTRARDAAGALKTNGRLNAPVTVMLLDGTYHLAEPLELGAEDSGEADKPITYCAYPGHRPVITGGRRLDDWQPYRDRILQARVPEAAGGRFKFRQLFFNGQRMIRARWPSFEPAEPYHGGWAFVEKTVPEDDEDAKTFQYEPPAVAPRPWANLHQAELFIFPWYNWVSELLPIAAADHTARTITLGGSFLMPGMALFPGNRFCVQNVLEELNQPGEWCLDTDAGVVYFRPPADRLDPGAATVPVPDRLIGIVGTGDRPAEHICIRGLTFTQTLCTFPEQLHPNFHSPTRRGEAIRIENARHCRIEDNRIEQVGGDGIRLQEATADIAVVNNEISHTGAFKKNCGGVQVYGVNSVDNVISHNEIHHTSDKGMVIQDGFGRFIVEYNHLHDIALEICDTGGIMTNRWFVLEGDADLGRANIFRYNLIENVIGCGAHAKLKEGPVGEGNRAGGRIWSPYYTWGIYFDNSGMNCTIFGNIIIGTMLGGTSTPVADPKDNLIANNIIIDCGLHQIDLRVGGADGRGNRVLRNILSYRNPDADLLAINPRTADAYAECDYNLYDPPAGAQPTIEASGFCEDEPKVQTFQQWRDLGRDEHSRFGDPLFVDRDKGDWRLRPESPAFELGFQPIDVSKIGRRGHRT